MPVPQLRKSIVVLKRISTVATIQRENVMRNIKLSMTHIPYDKPSVKLTRDQNKKSNRDNLKKNKINDMGEKAKMV